MKRSAFAALFVLFFAVQTHGAASSDAVEDRCLARSALVSLLVDEFGEQLVEVHATVGGLREFHVSPDDGTWTAVVTDGWGTSCVVASGDDVDPSKTLLDDTFIEI